MKVMYEELPRTNDLFDLCESNYWGFKVRYLSFEAGRRFGDGGAVLRAADPDLPLSGDSFAIDGLVDLREGELIN